MVFRGIGNNCVSSYFYSNSYIIVFISLLLSISTFQNGLQAQVIKDNRKNNTYIEGLGTGGWVSINHEYMLSKESGLALRAGLGYWSEGYGGYLMLPISFHKLFPLKGVNKFIDAGIGAHWGFKDGIIFGERPEGILWNLLAQVGYRMHINEKIMFRISGMVGVGDGLFPFIGLSVGKRY
jgi:hypothetical protein